MIFRKVGRHSIQDFADFVGVKIFNNVFNKKTRGEVGIGSPLYLGKETVMRHYKTLAMVAMLLLSVAFPFGCLTVKSDKPIGDSNEVPRVVKISGLAILLDYDPNPDSQRDLAVFIPGDGDKYGHQMQNFGGAYADPEVVTAVVARPGCSIKKVRSSGVRSRGTYPAGQVKRIAEAVRTLKDHFKADRVVLFGHSGGGAIALIIAGKYPGLVNGVFALSAPGNMEEWRRHHGYSSRDGLSPHQFLKNVPKTTIIRSFSGAEDDNVLPKHSAGYVEKAQELGIDAQHFIIDGDHNDTINSRKVHRAFQRILFN